MDLVRSIKNSNHFAELCLALHELFSKHPRFTRVLEWFTKDVRSLHKYDDDYYRYFEIEYCIVEQLPLDHFETFIVL